MNRRTERKQETRVRLIVAALQLMEDSRPFASLGLREVTREAGLTPNSFYRHFADMDDLALAIIDEIGLRLRRLLREVRRAGLPQEEIVRRSVQVYKAYVQEHSSALLFAARERFGGSARIRAALRDDIRYFTQELADDLALLNLFPQMDREGLELLADLVIQMMLNAAKDFADVPPKRPDLEAQFENRYVHQLMLVFLGAGAWRPALPARRRLPAAAGGQNAVI